MNVLRNLLMVAVVLFMIVAAVQAVTEVAVHDACEFDEARYAVLVTPDGGDIVLDLAEVNGWQGLIRPNAKGSYVGEITIVDVAGHLTRIDLYSYGGVARPWSLACDNGANLRIRSDYLDCRLAGVC